MTKVRFIGDTHGNRELLIQAIHDYEEGKIECIYHVGDIGVGFYEVEEELDAIFTYVWYEKIPFIAVRGNHDNPGNWVFGHEKEDHTTSYRMHAGIKSGFYPNHTMNFVINGALSIDQHSRVEGVDWWSDEELSIQELNVLVDSFAENKPKFVISHDCPQVIAEKHLFSKITGEMQYPSRTRQAMDAMLNCHKPDLWIFGHWHESRDKVIDGTRFICVAKNSFIDLDI